MTKATSQRKTLPQYCDFEEEGHYESLQKEVRATSKKNKELDDMILRFYIKVQPKPMDGDANGEESILNEPTSPLRPEGRQVNLFIVSSDYRQLQADKKKHLQACPKPSFEPSTRLSSNALNVKQENIRRTLTAGSLQGHPFMERSVSLSLREI